jgi:hypothetical protein
MHIQGSKVYLPRYTELGVNMRGAQLCRLAHGFGEYKTATKTTTSSRASVSNINTGDTAASATATASAAATAAADTAAGTTASSTTTARATAKATAAAAAASAAAATAASFYGDQFSFYHGQFVEGERHGQGVLYSETGAYYGGFCRGQRLGNGQEHRSDGTHITGVYSPGERFDSVQAQLHNGCQPPSTARTGSSKASVHSSSSTGSGSTTGGSGSASNPYAMGVLNGTVRIAFADGAVYSGEMRDGRVTGCGEYTSVLGEQLCGTFRNGELHSAPTTATPTTDTTSTSNSTSSSESYCCDASGQVWEGTWRNGCLHGSCGRYSSAELGSYTGDWCNGDRRGKGESVLPSGTVHKGFYLDGDRCGLGAVVKGNVKTVADARTGGAELKGNRVYEVSFWSCYF